MVLLVPIQVRVGIYPPHMGGRALGTIASRFLSRVQREELEVLIVESLCDVENVVHPEQPTRERYYFKVGNEWGNWKGLLDRQGEKFLQFLLFISLGVLIQELSLNEYSYFGHSICARGFRQRSAIF
jgi:hypothetical protein